MPWNLYYASSYLLDFQMRGARLSSRIRERLCAIHPFGLIQCKLNMFSKEPIFLSPLERLDLDSFQANDIVE